VSTSKIPFLYDVVNKEYVDLDGDMLFGRHSSCDITVKDDLVSSQHFKLSIKGTRAFVTDLASSNKTTINEQELEPNMKNVLRHGDRLAFGEQKYVYFFENQDKFSIPDFTKTHSLKVNEEPTSSEIFFEEMYEFHDNKNDKKSDGKNYIKLLKDSRQNILNLEEKAKAIEEQVKSLEKAKKEEVQLAEEVADLKIKLAKYNFNSNEDFEKEKSDYDFSLSELTQSIEKVTTIIKEQQSELERYNQQMKKVKESLVFINNLQEKFSMKTSMEEELANTREEIAVVEGLDLQGQIVEIQESIAKENKNHKFLQEGYGSKLKTGKKPGREKWK